MRRPQYRGLLGPARYVADLIYFYAVQFHWVIYAARHSL